MNSNLVLLAVLCTFALSPACAMEDDNTTHYNLEIKVSSNLEEEFVKVSFDLQITGPNVSYKTDLTGKPRGWYNAHKWPFLKRVPKEINLYDATEYTLSYYTFDDDANTKRVVSISNIAIVEPYVADPKNIHFCFKNYKNTHRTAMKPGKPVTLTRCP